MTLEQAVTQAFTKLQVEHATTIVPIYDDEVLMVMGKAIFRLSTEPEGGNIDVLRLEGSLLNVYMMGVFLGDRSRAAGDKWSGEECESREEADFRQYAWYLENHGADIISGDESWVKDWSADGSKPYPLNPGSKILRVLQQQQLWPQKT